MTTKKCLGCQVLCAALEVMQQLQQQFSSNPLLLEALRALLPLGTLLLKEAAELGEGAVRLLQHVPHGTHLVAEITRKAQGALHALDAPALLLELPVHVVHLILDAGKTLANLLQLGILHLQLVVPLAHCVRDLTELMLQGAGLVLKAAVRVLEDLRLRDLRTHLCLQHLALTLRCTPLSNECLSGDADCLHLAISFLDKNTHLSSGAKELLLSADCTPLLAADQVTVSRLRLQELLGMQPVLLLFPAMFRTQGLRVLRQLLRHLLLNVLQLTVHHLLVLGPKELALQLKLTGVRCSRGQKLAFQLQNVTCLLAPQAHRPNKPLCVPLDLLLLVVDLSLRLDELRLVLSQPGPAAWCWPRHPS
mmetsp:Transcript_101051/g.314269  ORF Transcript_101051/g.314269 Transcript_101051/m.314269 type:complete len:363 (-) Transcript_101051:54-1142(-)